MIRLAVVEDQPQFRTDTVQHLGDHFGVSASVVGFSSVEELLADGGGFDVVVLDLQLRGGGAENAGAVRAAAACGRVVVYSGQESAEALQQARDAGAAGYVSKFSDDSAAVLAAAVGAVLRGELFADPQMTARIGAAARRHLTARQQQVLRLEALGRTTGQIARELNLSEAGVRRHVEHLIEIFPDFAKQADRVRLALRLGLISPFEDYRPTAAGR